MTSGIILLWILTGGFGASIEWFVLLNERARDRLLGNPYIVWSFLFAIFLGGPFYLAAMLRGLLRIHRIERKTRRRGHE